MNLLERIQLVCDIKNITPTLLEREVGLSKGAIYKWNKSYPSADKLHKVATYLNCPIGFLLGDDAINIPPWLDGENQLGDALKEERENNQVSIKELSNETGIPEGLIRDYETGVTVSDYLLSLICNALSLNMYEFLLDHNLYGDSIPDCFNSDVERYESFKKALESDHFLENDTVGLKDMNHVKIGEAIKKEREANQLSNKELSQKSGILENIIVEYENGVTPVEEYILTKICAVLGLDVFEFLIKHDFYDDCIPSCFNGDVSKYETLKNTLKQENRYFESEEVFMLPDDAKAVAKAYSELSAENQKLLKTLLKMIQQTEVNEKCE